MFDNCTCRILAGICCLLLFTSLLSTVNCFKLRGVSLESHPFIVKDGNQYKGYTIDVLNAMKNVSNFNYYLTDATELGVTYRVDNQTHISGLLGEVWTNKADFGVSDIRVTAERKRFVDFTDPLLNASVSALIHKSNIGRMKTFNDLADQTRITYGSLRNSSTMKLFVSSNDMVLRRMYALMNSTGVSVDSLEEAIDRIRSSRYAFIGDSMTVEMMAKSNCDFAIITDNRDYFHQQIAIALPKGSQWLTIFNRVIQTLIQNQTIDKIKDKYWKVDCTVRTNSAPSALIPANFAISTFIIPNLFLAGFKIFL